ncbi:MAG: GTP cyclohydrolase I FolE2, partial [Candidatus Altiarchaeota archaeon]|nr:GTP cyclohydrolase I FolE2 [Candidatus Altiarchaeota archaeon]
MTDTQDTKPDVLRNLERVGIVNLKTLIETNWKGSNYRFAPDIEITIDLEKDRKGIHMSRLIESITESVEEETRDPAKSIEEIEKKILENLSRKHPYNSGEVKMVLDFFVERQTPKTGKPTLEAHKAAVIVSKDEEGFSKRLWVRVLGNTSCPHSTQTCGKPHIQRAIGELTVEATIDSEINLEDMITVVEESFSSPVYTLLKTSDEVKVVEKMYANPKFVEDVVRGMLEKSQKRFKNCKIKAK